MDRRKSLKIIGLGAVSTSVLVGACKDADKKTTETPKATAGDLTIDRTKEEADRDKKLMSSNFFTEHEMATLGILTDIIIPKDDVSGSATDAKVPEFIDFIVQDMPNFQTPLRGGLRWLDMESIKRFEKSFTDISAEKRIQIVDDIAYPAKAKPEFGPGVQFFSLVRNLTATGFYSSAIGIKDVGYVGNVANKWNGVPDDVLKQYGMEYSERELRESASYS